MRILVTGANGFIGRNLTKRLLQDGDEVVSIFDSCGDIDAIVHLAAIAGIRPELQQAQEHYKVNVLETVDLLELCTRRKIPKFIFISSSAVYGDNGNRPSLETDSTDKPLCHYSATKKSGELACYTYHNCYNLDVTCFRLFTVYGPGQKTEMAIPLFTKSILSGKEIEIFGDGYRDYVYVDDAVQAIIKSLDGHRGYEIYNIGSSMQTSLIELVFYLEEIIGKKAKVIYKSTPIGYAPSTWASIAKARKELGYLPQVKIKDGLKRYVDWYRSQKF